MKLTKQLLLLKLIGFSLVFLFMPFSAAEENLKEICPKRKDKPDAWQQRDENRCEGINFSLVTTSTANLVSVTLKPDFGMEKVPELYLWTHSSTAPNSSKLSNETKEIVVREYKRNYWLDHLELREQGSYKTFQWSTDILQSAGIEPGQLHGSAKDDYDTFSPVIIAPSESPSSLSYEFGIYADEKYLKLISFQIQDRNENVVYKINSPEDSNLSQHEFITVKWNGKNGNGQPLERGIYSIFVEVEMRDDVDVRYPAVPTVDFFHDPALIR